MLEVKELVKLHNLHIHHVMLQSELKNVIAAKAVGTGQLAGYPDQLLTLRAPTTS